MINRLIREIEQYRGYESERSALTECSLETIKVMRDIAYSEYKKNNRR